MYTFSPGVAEVGGGGEYDVLLDEESFPLPVCPISERPIRKVIYFSLEVCLLPIQKGKH